MGLFKDIHAIAVSLAEIANNTRKQQGRVTIIPHSRRTGLVGERRVFRAAGYGTIPLFRTACDNCKVRYIKRGTHLYIKPEDERIVIAELKAMKKKA